jgi:hypothetical protein
MLRVKLFFVIISSVLSISVHADYSDCTESDKCKFEDCDVKVITVVDGATRGNCHRVYKYDKKKERHVFAYFELQMKTQARDSDKDQFLQNAMVIRIRE